MFTLPTATNCPLRAPFCTAVIKKMTGGGPTESAGSKDVWITNWSQCFRTARAEKAIRSLETEWGRSCREEQRSNFKLRTCVSVFVLRIWNHSRGLSIERKKESKWSMFENSSIGEVVVRLSRTTSTVSLGVTLKKWKQKRIETCAMKIWQINLTKFRQQDRVSTCTLGKWKSKRKSARFAC